MPVTPITIKVKFAVWFTKNALTIDLCQRNRIAETLAKLITYYGEPSYKFVWVKVDGVYAAWWEKDKALTKEMLKSAYTTRPAVFAKPVIFKGKVRIVDKREDSGEDEVLVRIYSTTGDQEIEKEYQKVKKGHNVDKVGAWVNEKKDTISIPTNRFSGNKIEKRENFIYDHLDAYHEIGHVFGLPDKLFMRKKENGYLEDGRWQVAPEKGIMVECTARSGANMKGNHRVYATDIRQILAYKGIKINPTDYKW